MAIDEGAALPADDALRSYRIAPPEDEFYIHARSGLVDAQPRVLKHGETFAVLDRYGDVSSAGLGEEGVYHEGTRFLSRLELRAGGRRPLLLGSTIHEDNAVLSVDLTNPDLERAAPQGQTVHSESIHLLRSKLLWDGSCYEQLRLQNYGRTPARITISYGFAADFRDLFEVRGSTRALRGTISPPIVRDSEVELSYEGLDGLTRTTRIACSPQPDALSGETVRFEVELPPRGTRSIFLTACFTCDPPESTAPQAGAVAYSDALAKANRVASKATDGACRVTTSDAHFNRWVERSLSDLRMMRTETAHGPYVYAGVPWYSTPFGRDAIITALQMLWVEPQLAHGVLSYLAATQAEQFDDERDAEPGKVLHESRLGEMARLGEIPFDRYYGSVDATPLFVMLAGAYYAATHDRALIERIWPSILSALNWIDEHGDLDDDGFVEYRRRSEHGLVQQGWKDSADSVFHADGTLAEAPVALCEVQGYVYAAREAAAAIAAALGDDILAQTLHERAVDLRQHFDEAFWCEELGSYALALDGHKRQCRVRASNAGHALFTGIAMPERAHQLADTLLSEGLYSGWGVRTLGAGEVRYNPMSYHNGSVWPHDNALVADGLARYQFKSHALRILSGLYDASFHFDLQRVPELFCGFERRNGGEPTLYPLANAPQAWAAATPFMLLRACLGMTVDAVRQQLRFHQPLLPEFLEMARLAGVRVGAATVDLELRRHGDDVHVAVTDRNGAVDVLTID